MLSILLASLAALAAAAVGVAWVAAAISLRPARPQPEMPVADDPVTAEREDLLWRARERYATSGADELIGERVALLEEEVAAALDPADPFERGRELEEVGAKSLDEVVARAARVALPRQAGSGTLASRPSAEGLPDGYVFYVEDEPGVKYAARHGTWLLVGSASAPSCAACDEKWNEEVALEGGPYDGRAVRRSEFHWGYYRAYAPAEAGVEVSYVGVPNGASCGDGYPVMLRVPEAEVADYRLERSKDMEHWVGVYVEPTLGDDPA